MPGSTANRVEWEFIDATGHLSESEVAWIDAKVASVIGELGVTGRLEARLVRDAEMATLHERFGGVAGTTDVLTFDMRAVPGAAGCEIEADLVVCLDEAERQSLAHGHPREREVLLYVVHGLLHCLGYDDQDEDGARAMHAREDAVLAAVGVGPVYMPRGRGGVEGTSG
ncbi:MAG: rRNA maturation RNase YbeY [Phycisphaerae bacterium]|nr:rRNA maturation RNase YbeY [Phycisphaerae bacterium]